MSQLDLTPDSGGTRPAETPAVGPGGGAKFVDRRSASRQGDYPGERRQFGSSHSGLSEAGRELALAIDRYKVMHHRRYLTCDEMLTVLAELGYQRTSGD
jgi:hypothetical protein